MLLRQKRSLFVAALFSMLVLNSSFACDINSFVQTEFSQRFEQLVNLSNKLEIALRIRHPDVKVISGALIHEWMSFYLSHGFASGQPDAYNFIKPEAWEKSLKNTGVKIAKFVRSSLDRKEYEVLILRITMLKRPEVLRQIRQQLKLWNNNELVSPKQISSMLIEQANLISNNIRRDGSLLKKLDIQTNLHLEALNQLELLREDISYDSYQTLFEAHISFIKEDIESWQNLFFIY